MKKLNKIISILMITTLMFSILTNIVVENKVHAATLPITKAHLYSKGEVVLFEYDGIGIGVEIQMHLKDGVEYPVYCLNKGRIGVTLDYEYDVKINSLVTNQKIWRAVINGYPFKTPAELGCNNVEEAYAATKMAVYDAMYNYDLNKFTIHKDLDSHRRAVKAIKQIITNARKSTDTKIAAALEINDESKIWTVDNIDKKYVSKIYSVKASAVNEKYKVSLSGVTKNNFKITDILNNEKIEFSKNEKFKVLIPISELENDGEFMINVSSSLKTLPVFYGESPSDNLQNVAVTVGNYELADTTLKQNYEKNKTKIQIQKQDGDTKKTLKNAAFNLLDINKQILYSELRTDNEGIIEIENLIPGKYYLEEIEPPDGYYGYDQLIPIEVKLNEKLIISIDNYRKQEKNTNTPEFESYISVIQKKLPKTGF